MDRKEFSQKLLALGVWPLLFSNIPSAFADDDKKLQELQNQKEFIQNWLADLLESMTTNLDRQTQIRIIEACGRGCYNRHQFKKNLAISGKDNLNNLIKAYSDNFEIWEEGDNIHIRYGEVSARCYCPAANYREPKPDDLHCECTRASHQTIFETALGHRVKVDILESLRRGGKTCRFLVHI